MCNRKQKTFTKTKHILEIITFYPYSLQPRPHLYPLPILFFLCVPAPIPTPTLILFLNNTFVAPPRLYSHPILPPSSLQYVKLYQNRRLGDLPPHIFAIADAAFYRMLNERKNQTIVLTGKQWPCMCVCVC